jgi:hypothetical protein
MKILLRELLHDYKELRDVSLMEKMSLKFITTIIFFFIYSMIFSQETSAPYLPPYIGQIDSQKYNNYISLLKESFKEDEITSNYTSKHNIYVSYYHLKVHKDTIFKFYNKSIDFDPVKECEHTYKGKFSKPINDTLSKKFHKEWKQICMRCDSVYSKFNKELIEQLKKIEASDQEFRGKEASAEDWKKQNIIDSLNTVKVEKIISTYGYPGKNLVGSEYSETAFLVIQHASLEVQEKYLPIIKEAATRRQIRKSPCALLIDRINMRKGVPQIYGTQLVFDKLTGKYKLYPIENIKNVDERRKEVGLGTLREYLKDNNID